MLVAAIALAALWSKAAMAQPADCDGRYFGNAQAVYVDFDDRVVNDQAGVGARFGLGRQNCSAVSGYSHWELNLNWNSVLETAQDGDDQVGLMLHRLRLWSGARWRPFWQAGVGFQQEAVLGDRAYYPAIEAGVGVLRYLGSSGLALRLDAAVQGVFNGDALTDDDFHHDARLGLGLLIPIGARPAPPSPPPATPAAPPPPPAAPPADTDGDGIADAADQCPDTPIGRTVDATGCVADVDADDDGVPDREDACADTLVGLKVDLRGCVRREPQALILKGVNFPSNSADLTDDTQKILDSVHATLAGDPGLRVEIGGHTDASGREVENRKLSQRRADSVRLYLAGRGIDATRLLAQGYGSARPVVDNATPDGRAVNRRVELRILQ